MMPCSLIAPAFFLLSLSSPIPKSQRCLSSFSPIHRPLWQELLNKRRSTDNRITLFRRNRSKARRISQYSNSESLTFKILCGISQCTGWPSVFAVVGNWFGKSKRGLIMGFWNSHPSTF
ncbi:hypothetical protein SOVF_061370 [Spinacia oleracea]|nr:hypothetical protein SOVF_061370 [Spinacia oleracea]